MKRFLQLRLIELLTLYVGLFTIYVMLPQPIAYLRHIIAPLMAIMIAMVLAASVRGLKNPKS